MASLDGTQAYSKICAIKEDLFKALIKLVQAIELFALHDTDLQLLTAEEKKSWLFTKEGKDSWNALAKANFTQHFKELESNEASRRARQSEFKGKVYTILRHCQAQGLDYRHLHVEDVTKILENSKIDQGSKQFSISVSRHKDVMLESDRRCTVYCEDDKVLMETKSRDGRTMERNMENYESFTIDAFVKYRFTNKSADIQCRLVIGSKKLVSNQFAAHGDSISSTGES